MRKAGIIIGVMVAVAFIIYIGIFASPKVNQDDQIVVTCAEAILWDYSYTYTPEWGYVSPDDSHVAFLVELASDDIFLCEEHHPFIENEGGWLKLQGYSSYTAFKADYYRNIFDWGNLPPAQIMNRES